MIHTSKCKVCCVIPTGISARTGEAISLIPVHIAACIGVFGLKLSTEEFEFEV